MDAPVPQQNASSASFNSIILRFLSSTVQPSTDFASSMIDDRVIPGNIVFVSSGGVTIVFVFANTAKKFDAPASSIFSPLINSTK